MDRMPSSTCISAAHRKTYAKTVENVRIFMCFICVGCTAAAAALEILLLYRKTLKRATSGGAMTSCYCRIDSYAFFSGGIWRRAVVFGRFIVQLEYFVP